jgi:Protein of unknown function (DUF2795)
MPSNRGRARSRSRSSRPSEGPTKSELYQQARRLGIEGRSKMSKAQLARAVGRRQQPSSVGRSSQQRRSEAPAHPVEVQKFLEGVGYPTRKQRLIEQARSQGASRDVRETIEQLPERQFDSPTEVSEAIGSMR